MNVSVKEPAESSIQHQSEHDTVDIPIDLGIYKCFYIDCVPPPDPNISPPVNHTPLNYQYWHDKSIWNRTNDGYMTNVGKIGNHLPVDFDNVKIISYTWVLVNFTNICKLNTLLLYGVLEFVNGHDAAYTLEAGLIIIKGGRLIIGWPDNPFIGHARIIMYGNDSLSAFNPKKTGVLLRRKTIGVFGGFDLFGRETGTSWTNLKFSANTGDRKIVLSEKVQWLKGDEIVISPTGFGPWQSETFKIISIGNDQSTIELNDTLKFKHIVHQEVLQSGQIITLKAAVGLLTRNIKIVDANPNTGGGARVLVGLFIDNGKTYKGYTRLSNVEFYHTGSKNSYPSHSLTFIDVGQVNYIKPSVVANCSFHKSISTAIGLIGIRNISLVNNVVYDAYDNGIMTDALSTKLVRNLVIKVRNVGIDAMKSQNLILQDNHVTSSSKIAYHVPAIGCDDTGNIYRNNKMYSNVRGAVLSNGHFTNSMCVKIIGFVGWKNINIGLLYRGHTIKAVFEENILIENQVGLSADILSNRHRRQSYIDVSVKIRNITFIGQTSSFHCGDMVWFRSNRFMLASFFDRDWHYSDGMVGIVFPQFQTIGGFTKLENVSFVKYGESLCQKNYAITTNVESNELQRPMHSENISLSQVSHANKILFLRSPRTSHFSCYSMECDVVRFAVYTDIDGSFLQTVGTLIQKSEHTEIDYYHKLPREMTTMLNGSRIPIEQIATYRGVVRNSNCTFEPMWQAYACNDDLSFKLLLIENLDSDARYRQISPIALLADGYIDLLDVPLDNGQCAHHFCTKRNTLFNALIVTGRSYKIHFTRTTPRKMRYRLLNTGPSEGIKLTVWYSRPNRLDVFVNGDFIIASNARIDRFGRYILSMSRGVEFIPQLANISGTNYFDRSRGEITFIVKGKAQIDIISQETFIVSFGFPALSYSELFGQSIVEHLAAFLDIPLTKVRIVNVVSESINGRSKRSEDDNMIIEIEIGNEPKQEMNMTIEDSIEKSALAELVAKIVNECQLGNISNILDDSIVCGKIEFPPDDIEIAIIIYNNEYPVHLYFHDKPEAEYENVLLETQPKIRAFDFEGLNVTNLGTVEYPWKISVMIRNGTGHPLAVLSGSLAINCTDGWFNFSDLAISHSGLDYVLDFNIIYPKEAEHFILESDTFNVNGRPLKIHVRNETIDEVYAFEQFSVTLNLIDRKTEETITYIHWRGHNWFAEVSLIKTSAYGSLNGILNTSFNIDNGQATFDNLSINGIGLYYLKFEVISDPPEYDLFTNLMIAVQNPIHENMTAENTATIKLKLNASFGEILTTEDELNAFEQTFLTEYLNMWQGVKFLKGYAYAGSISVEFAICGTAAEINTIMYGICSLIYNGTMYTYNNETFEMLPYLTINNEAFYGVKCGAIPFTDITDEHFVTSWLFLVSISVVSMIVVIALLTCAIWKCYFVPKTKIHGVNCNSYTDVEKLSIENLLYVEPCATVCTARVNTGIKPKQVPRSFQNSPWKW